MEFKKPEDVDNEPAWSEESNGTDSEAAEPATVSFMGDEMMLDEAVRLTGEMLKSPEQFGMASGSEVRELRETVEQQERAIAELAEAIDALSSQMMNQGVGGVALELEPLSGIYDPTTEFDNG